MLIFFSKIVPFMRQCGKICRTGQVTDDDMTHALFTLFTQDYKHTLRICNTYCVSTATVVSEIRLNVTLYVHCLSCLCLNLYSFRQNVRGEVILKYVLPLRVV